MTNIAVINPSRPERFGSRGGATSPLAVVS